MNKELVYSLVRYGQGLPKTKAFKFEFSRTDMDNLFKLRNACKKHNRFCENYCNVENFNPDLIDKQEEKINKIIQSLPVGLGIKLKEIQRDPRGWTVKFTNYFFSQFVWS